MAAVLAVVGILVSFLGLFFVVFKKGKRLRGLGIFVAGMVMGGIGGGLQASKDAEDAGFSNVADMQMARKAGITDPKEFEAKRGEVEARIKAEADAAAEAKRLEEVKRQEEKAASVEKATQAEAEKQAKAAAEEKFYAPPAVQSSFVGAIEEARGQYKNAANELAKGGVRRDRAKALCAVQKGAQVSNWSGKLVTLTTNGDGLGVVAIEIAPDVAVKTWNNALSDIGSKTMLDPDSKLFRKLATLKVGDRVLFSGQFLRDSATVDCFHESSLTMDGAMRSPEFIFRFSDVKVMEP